MSAHPVDSASLFADPRLLVQAIAQATDDAIFAKDLRGRYVFANPAALDAMGKCLGEVIGHTDAQLMAEAGVAARMMQSDRLVLDHGQTTEIEVSTRTADGGLRHWTSRKMPLRDAAGRVTGLLGIARDITASKEAAAEREADRMRLRMGVQAAGLVMAEIDYQHDRNHISAELAQLLELGEGEMIVPRQAIFDRVHPEDRPRYMEGIAHAIDPAGDGHLAIDVRALLPSGKVLWMHILLQVTFTVIDGRLRPDRGYCAARDVTEELIAQRKLRAAQRLTESVIEGAGALVFAKDLQGRFILSNQAWRNLHGLHGEAAEQATDVQIFGPEVAAMLRETDLLVARTGQSVTVQEKAVVRGQHVTYRSNKFPLYDDSGEVYAVCGVSTDITDVVEADRRKDEFIATLAHELRNPLAPIRNGLEILKRMPGLPAPAQKIREVMDRQLVHMVRLVDDLLDVSRITRDKLEMRVGRITLGQVIDLAVEASRPGIDAVGHVLQVDLQPGAVWLEGDLTRLAQVVSNLLNNAAKYMAPGGRIELAARQEDDQAVIVVRDSGVGIAPDMLPRVFDLFAQVDGTRQQAQGGLGIGLWLVKKLVELHRGSISARSAGQGMGSTFEVRLPVAVADADAASANAAAAQG
jgi:PAS domain S-box-containing protein